MPETDRTVRLVIHGHVQGVWYRGWLQGEARRLQLSGWARNRSDGTVEVILSGPADAVETLIGHCAEGPPSAQVEHIDIAGDESRPQGDFEIRGTL